MTTPRLKGNAVSTITIELPEQIRESLEAQWQELPRYLLEHLAVEGYRTAALSQGQAGEMLGLNYWEAQAFLSRHKVYPQYDVEDFLQDLATLELLSQKHP